MIIYHMGFCKGFHIFIKGSVYDSTSTKVFFKKFMSLGKQSVKSSESAKNGPISHWVSGQEEKTDTKMICWITSCRWN